MSQVIKKRKIVIASVLKPADDTRMFGKIGQSLANTGQYEIHIMGYPGGKPHDSESIFFHPFSPFGRLSLKRLTIPWLVLKRALFIKPSLTIITTHELLLCGVLLKIFCGSNLVYDVQENYYLNIRYVPSFPTVIRPLLAWYVRMKERIFAGWIDLFILSDDGYKSELPFLRKKFVVVENKVRKASILPGRPKPGNDIVLLFSGTLARSTGVFTAIDLANKLYELDNRIRLKIIGYCSQPETLRQLQEIIKNRNYAELFGGDRLVPHNEIMRAIAAAHFGIIAYPPNPATENTFPTKLFEYLGARLPILLISHKPWVDRCASYKASLVFNPDNLNAAKLLERMKSTGFYLYPPGKEIYWESEAEKLVQAINRL